MAQRSKSFDKAADAKAFEGKVRTLKRAGDLAELDAGTETLAEFADEWWRLYAASDLERATLENYASMSNAHALPRQIRRARVALMRPGSRECGPNVAQGSVPTIAKARKRENPRGCGGLW